VEHVFSEQGAAALERLSRAPTLYAFDFDGTLSRIVDFPQHARLAGNLRKSLPLLSKQVPVVIISGRGLADLVPRIEVPGLRCIGNHGAEGVGLPPSAIEHAEMVCRGWRAALTRLLKTAPVHHGIEVEDKELTLAIHYRRSHNYATSRHSIEAAIAQLEPAPRVVEGKAVYNLIPVELPDKGEALEHLMHAQGMTDALYVGDDDTDEDVFSLLNPSLVSVRVGHSTKSKARYYVREQAEVELLVERLIELCLVGPRRGTIAADGDHK
jgi:trehalose 6-phosphate phosphatase